MLGYYRERTPVRTFHAAHCLAEPGRGQFAALDQFHRHTIAKQLSRVICDRALHPIWCGVVVDDWHEATTENFRLRYPKPFDLCFEYVVARLWEWSQTYADGEKIAPMFAYQNEYKGSMDAVDRAFRRNADFRKVLGPIAFGYPEDVLPLQCADFLAHEVGEYWRHVLYDDITWVNVGPRRLMGNLTETRGRPPENGVYDASAIKAAIRRFEKMGSAYGCLPWASDGQCD